MASFLGTIASGIRNVFQDTFNRSNQTGIGTASDGSLWNAVRGSFNITGNKADGQTPANYPLISVDMPKEEVTISLKGVTQGSTASLWITNSGNWYGIGIDQEQTDCNCQTCETPGNCNAFFTQCNAYGTVCNVYSRPCNSASYPCNGGNYFCDVVGNRFCSAWNTRNCANFQPGFCSSYSRPCTRFVGSMCVAWATNCSGFNAPMCTGWNTGNCSAYNSGNCNATNSMYTCTTYSTVCNAYSTVCNSASYPCNSSTLVCQPGAFNASTFYQCNCQTCFPQYIRFIQSVSNSISQLTSWAVGSVIQSFKVIVSAVNPNKTSATTTIKAYSDTNLTNQIGTDLTYTPTGVAISAQYGIMVKPSTYQQGTTIDEVSIET